MANVMSLKSLRNKVSRNGFDLSRKNCFTAKCGELLPVFVEECLPGDKFKINPQWFTRTQPINTAAYTRLREYVDFYFVPTRLLWRDFNSFALQVPNQQKALALTPNVNVLTTNQPYFTAKDLATYINSMGENQKNFFGYQRSLLTCKLFDYLGYGNIWKQFITMTSTELNQFFLNSDGIITNPNYSLNIFPLLAYQKIYADYYRNNQWEKIEPSSFNVDYINGYGRSINPHLSVSQLYTVGQLSNYNMFDLRYCDWNKDYFMGLLPSAQYGDEAVASPLQGVLSVDGSITYSSLDTEESYADVVGDLNINNNTNAGLSVIALRKAEAMQRWKEITQSGDYDVKTQFSKHWNVEVSNILADQCSYLGGCTSNLDISEVVNTNLTGDAISDIAGKGTSAGQGFIDYDCKEYGYIIGIYHCVPLLDYAPSLLKPLYKKTQPTDYAIPEMDKVGMQAVSLLDLMPFNDSDSGSSAMNDTYWTALQKLTLGYAPRYVEYKTSVDQIHGEFADSLISWVAPMTTKYIQNYFARVDAITGTDLPSYALDYWFFKVNPNIVDTIFAVNVDSSTATDNLLVNSYFDCKAVRNLDYDGLPY